MGKFTAEEIIARRAERAAAKQAAKEVARIDAEKNAKRVKEMFFSIEWKANRTWGSNPTLTCEVIYEGESWRTHVGNYTASGCGYSKENAVIEEAINAHLRYLIWELVEKGITQADLREKVYGVHLPSKDWNHVRFSTGGDFEYLFKYFGGNFRRVASGKSFDVYQLTFGAAQ